MIRKCFTKKKFYVFIWIKINFMLSIKQYFLHQKLPDHHRLSQVVQQYQYRDQLLFLQENHTTIPQDFVLLIKDFYFAEIVKTFLQPAMGLMCGCWKDQRQF